MTSRLAYAVAGEIAVVANLIEQDHDKPFLQATIDHMAQKLGLRISYEKGLTLELQKVSTDGYIWESLVAKTLARELESVVARPFALDLDLEEKWVQIMVQLNNGVMTVSLSGRRLFSSSGYIFLIWMLATSLVLLLVAILFMRNQIRPIRKLALAAEQFGKGREVASFKPAGAREVRQASQAFLEMHKRIKRQIEQRTAMLAGVSHDLRTPITRLKLQLAMLDDTEDTRAMKQDIEQMEKMIEGYLEFVRGEGNEPVEPTSIRDIFESVRHSAKRQGFNVTLSEIPEIDIQIRPLAFERCLNNIINNAGRYAEHIWIRVFEEGGKLNIHIDDDGPGISEDQYEDVFKPFFRADEARSSETGGVGLGLPIAMDIVHAHGGKIWLEKNEHGGLGVRIRLPL